MRQLIQDLANGTTSLVEAPIPKIGEGHLLVDTTVSLISTGTEKMLVNFGRSGLVSKVRAQPDKVVQVIEKAKTDGILATAKAVRSKLAQPIPLGYCNVGLVRETKVNGFYKGDRVASNGPHADVVSVPKNLCARIPDNVSDEAASFTVVASIGLQGVRLSKPEIGERFVVIGVGLIGLLTVQILLAHGCRVLAIDFDTKKLELARSFGAEVCNLKDAQDPIASSLLFSGGHGVDGVIITASTHSNEPIIQAAQMCRKRGRIVLVGVTGLELNRSDFYEKEISFQVSCSYGPGRYDPFYEKNGIDYPIGFVRWTEQRNFEAVLDMMSMGLINVEPLISHRFPFLDSPSAYDFLSGDDLALGILLKYEHGLEKRHNNSIELKPKQWSSSNGAIIGFIGAGNFASRVLIPALKSSDAILHTIVSKNGLNSSIQGRRMGFAKASSNNSIIFESEEINTVVIGTRHDSHASLAVKALNSGKHVFVEKPLALTFEQIEQVEQAYANGNFHLMVGFNRRFSSLSVKMKELMSAVLEPKSIVMTVNAGFIPPGHWTQDPKVGGGRIIGEACHFIDFARYLVGVPITSIVTRTVEQNAIEVSTNDKAVILLGFADGSFCTIHYLSNGGSAFPKERIEVFTANRTLQLDNFVKLKGFNWPGFRKKTLWRQDKGHKACVLAFVSAICNSKPTPISAEELFEVARVSIEATNQINSQG